MIYVLTTKAETYHTIGHNAGDILLVKKDLRNTCRPVHVLLGPESQTARHLMHNSVTLKFVCNVVEYTQIIFKMGCQLNSFLATAFCKSSE